MKQAGEEVKKTQICENSAENRGVPVDGCWQKRGFCFNVKVFNVEPMSKHCKQCQLQSKLDKNSKVYQDFKEKHIGCKSSYRGSSPAMEPEFLADPLKSTAFTTQSFIEMVTAKAIFL